MKRIRDLDVDTRVHNVELKKVVTRRKKDGWFWLGNSVEGSEWTIMWGK